MFQRGQNVVLISKGSSFLATVDTVVKHVALRCMSGLHTLKDSIPSYDVCGLKPGHDTFLFQGWKGEIGRDLIC